MDFGWIQAALLRTNPSPLLPLPANGKRENSPAMVVVARYALSRVTDQNTVVVARAAAYTALTQSKKTLNL